MAAAVRPVGAQPAAASRSTAPAPEAPMSGDQVIQVLDQTIDWYRTLGLQQQAAKEPSDLLILYENRQIANQVVGFAFDAARATADLLAKQSSGGPQRESEPGPGQARAQLLAKLDAQTSSVQSELDAQRHRATTATKKANVLSQAKIAELQAELDLINTKRSIVASMVGFESDGAATNSTTATLRAQIDAMAVALPSASAASPAPADSAAPANARPTSAPSTPSVAAGSIVAAEPSRFGLWDLAANVFALSEKKSTVDAIDARSAALQATISQIRDRLVAQMRTLSTRGDALAAQADTADSAALNAVHDQFDGLATQFKQLSAIYIPVSKESLLLGQYRHNLESWRDAIKNQSRSALKTLGIRLGILLVILVIVFALAELWRRAVLRYVVDSRRRYQLMLLRRIALSALVVIIVGFAFASELGSIVTFAGLITAGLAVAMQSVLVSIVGYFFLIGKYGIRVGDRVQIGEVHGEVIELGLVRMYLMELGGHGSLGPTGRVVAFANSVVFQVSSGLFKQIPGVNFTWHEITLAVPRSADYASTKEKLRAAVIDALKDYREEIQRQTREIQRTTMSSSGVDALPTVQLNYSSAGVEARVRYPVHLQHAAEIDERVSQALLQVISHLAPSAPAVTPA
jgi:small-conductance mechanosensitive channel